MAKENGYFSQKVFELYDTTGTTEDWSYNATGGFGFTFELYCGAPDYGHRGLRRARVPPALRDDGQGVGRHERAGRPRRRPGSGGYDGKGNREAYYIAAESTLDKPRHRVLEGTAAAGTRLRLTKEFKTYDPRRPPRHGRRSARVRLRRRRLGRGPLARQPVHATGRRPAQRLAEPWRPSPAPAEPPGRRPPAPASRATTARPPPATDPQSTDATRFNDHAIVVPSTGDNGSMRVRIEWSTLRQRLGRPASSRTPTATARPTRASAWSARARPTPPAAPAPPREVLDRGRPRLTPGAKYVLRVNNVSAFPSPTSSRSPTRPRPPYKPGQVESYTLTCEQNGKTLATQQVAISRGERKTLNLKRSAAIQRALRGEHGSGCARSARRAGAAACASASGASPEPAGADRRLPGLAGRRVIGERLAARFKARRKAVTWSGRGAKGDGLNFARYRMKTRNGKGTEFAPRRAAAAQRALQPPAGLLPARDLRPAAELQARAGRVRRAHRGTPLRIAFRVAAPARARR